jgi:alpha-L-fucosidase 2
LVFFLSGCFPKTEGPHSLKLWYKQAALEWTDALPVGNGRLGAMVFGNPVRERIQLNEESLWAGSKINNNNPGAFNYLPEIRRLILDNKIEKAFRLSAEHLLGTPPSLRSYQTLGDLNIEYTDAAETISDYTRSLNLRTGVHTTRFLRGRSVITCDVFSSAPANAIIVNIASSGKKGLTLDVSLSREKDAMVKAVNNELIMTGQIIDQENTGKGPGGAHMKFHSIVQVKNTDGALVCLPDKILVKGARNITLLITAATDYNIEKLDFDRSIDPGMKCTEIINTIADKSFQELLAEHVADHEALFNRIDFQLCGPAKDTVPTDIRLKNVISGGEDPHFTELYYQYGRYLLMGSSRYPGVLPANLQGIWNHHMEAPWNSDYHTNINLQMNYWLADVCNLPETMDPLTDFFAAICEPGLITARDMYGCRGWCMHHCTDVFGKTAIIDGIQWGTFPMAGLWMSLHFWEHFQYTNDTAYLSNHAWKIMKGAAMFALDFLVEDQQGQWVTVPSYSPENAFIDPANGKPTQLTYAATMDIQILREFFNASINAATIMNEDGTFIDSLKMAISKLPPTRIGKNGTIMEWIMDYDEAEPGHRHVSHLFGLHPGTQISPQTPELFQAAAGTLARRLENGGGHTGWSRAWIINFYARLLDAENAHAHLMALFRKSTLNNLFDTHPPFQIDGNFGGTAGITEMLLQSHNGFIHLLPALPEEWKNGKITGLKARGNYTVDIYWKDRQLDRLVVKAGNSGLCNIRYGNTSVKIPVSSGQLSTLNGKLSLITNAK